MNLILYTLSRGVLNPLDFLVVLSSQSPNPDIYTSLSQKPSFSRKKRRIEKEHLSHLTSASKTSQTKPNSSKKPPPNCINKSQAQSISSRSPPPLQRMQHKSPKSRVASNSYPRCYFSSMENLPDQKVNHI